MTPVLLIGLLPVKAEGLHDGGVLDGEEDCFLLTVIGMFMPGPRGHHKEISLLPVKPLAVDDRMAASLEGVVDGAVNLPVGLGVNSGPDDLNVAAHGRENGSTRVGI